MAPWWGERTAAGPHQHDPFVSTAGFGDSACVEAWIDGAGALVHDARDGAGRGGGGVGRDRNAGATPAKNIAATTIRGRSLARAAISGSSVWLTGTSSIAPSLRNASPTRRGQAWRGTGVRCASL